MEELDNRNTNGVYAGKVRWDHIKDGFHGTSMKGSIPLVENPIIQDELVRSWGLAKWTSEQLKATMFPR